VGVRKENVLLWNTSHHVNHVYHKSLEGNSLSILYIGINTIYVCKLLWTTKLQFSRNYFDWKFGLFDRFCCFLTNNWMKKNISRTDLWCLVNFFIKYKNEKLWIFKLNNAEKKIWIHILNSFCTVIYLYTEKSPIAKPNIHAQNRFSQIWDSRTWYSRMWHCCPWWLEVKVWASHSYFLFDLSCNHYIIHTKKVYG